MDLDKIPAVLRQSSRSDLLFLLALGMVLAATYLLYQPGIAGPLILDSIWNLEPLGNEGGVNSVDNFLQFVLSNGAGPSGRPVSMLSFLIDGVDWPINVAAFKYTNVMIHLLCGMALCWFALLLARQLGADERAAGLIGILTTALWLLHPLNVSTALYVVQRMTQLMTLFALLALVFYLLGRRALEQEPRRGLVLLCLSLFPFGLLSVLSKENGALLLVLIVALEATAFPRRSSHPWFGYWYRGGVLLPLFIVACYLSWTLQSSLEQFAIREYDAGERLLTQSRMLMLYLGKIFLPSAAGAGFFRDDIVISTGLFSPVTTLFSMLGLLAGLALAWKYRRRAPVPSLAIFWFLGAHLLESSYLPLELYFEHRNYLAMVGPLFALSWYLVNPPWPDATVHLGLRGLLILFLGVSLYASASLVRLWGNEERLYATWSERYPASIRAQVIHADYLRNRQQPEAAMERLQRALEHNPDEATVLLFQWNLACESGVDAPVSLAGIAANEELEYYRDDINFHLTRLVQGLLEDRCQYPDETTLVALFERLRRFPLPPRRNAAFHYLYSEIAVHYRRLGPALELLSEAFASYPNPQYPLRQAILAGSNGQYAAAFQFLDLAQQADATRWPWEPSVSAEIDLLRRGFELLQGRANGNDR